MTRGGPDPRRGPGGPRPRASARAAPPRSASAGWLVWAVPALVALALYARTLRFAFVWDDLDLIVRNAALLDPNDPAFWRAGAALKDALCAWLDAQPWRFAH